MNFHKYKSFLVLITFLILFSCFVPKASAQIDLADKSTVLAYLEGTWELNSHYYGIGGWLDTFPTTTEQYHYKFESTDNDSIVLMTLYQNKCWEAESYMNISRYTSPQGSQSWLISNYLNFGGPFTTNFFISESASTTHKLELYQGPDASQYTMTRVTADLSNYRQVPENFEFLDHRDKCNFNGGAKLVSDGIIYATNFYNRSWDFRGTAVFKANFDNKLDTLYKNQWDTKIKMKELNDSTFYFVLSEFFDYDVGIEGGEQISFTNEEISTTELLGDGLVFDIISDKQGGQWILNYDLSQGAQKLAYVDPTFGVVTKTIDVEPVHIHLHKDEDNIYLLGKNISRISNDSIEVLQELDSLVRDVKTYANSHYELTKGTMYKFSDRFRVATDTIEIPEHLTSFRKIILEPDGFSFLGETQLTLQNRQLNSDLYRDWVLPINEGETITDLLMRTSESVVVAGTSGCQTFIRQVNISQADENVYQKEKVSLELFTVQALAAVTGENIQSFAVMVELKNQGNKIVDFTDAYSSNFIPHNIDITTYIDINSELSIDPGVAVGIRDTIYATTGRDFSDLTLSNTGANHRFLENPQTIPVNFLSSLEELAEENQFVIYPNPSTGYITIDSNLELAAISIYNNLGQLVYHQSGKKITKQLELDFLPKGKYHVLLEEIGSGNIATSNFVIMK